MADQLFPFARYALGIDHDEHQPMNSEPVVGSQWGVNGRILLGGFEGRNPVTESGW